MKATLYSFYLKTFTSEDEEDEDEDEESEEYIEKFVKSVLKYTPGAKYPGSEHFNVEYEKYGRECLRDSLKELVKRFEKNIK